VSQDAELERKLHKLIPKVLKDLDIVYSAKELVTTKQFNETMGQIQSQQELRDEKLRKEAEEKDEKLRKEAKERDEKLRKDLDQRFEKVFQRLDKQSLALGHDFEEFNSLWLRDYLEVQGYPRIKIQKKNFYDENYEVFSDSKDIQIDLFNESPLVIGEVTAIVQSVKKVNDFIKKVKFLTDRFGEAKHVIFITYGIKPDLLDEVTRICEKNGIKLHTLRQSRMADFA